MVTIYVEGKPYQVPEDRNLLETCLSLGFDVPYFCWHPALGSAGACRQCAVKLFKNEKDLEGRIVMACMTPVKDGARVSIDDPEAKEFRAANIEWLMTNHPHDCPVCDEGGECHLQDMTVMSGHVYREYRFSKRTHRNQDLGPFIQHEMNRCIACYRCVRFYRDYAGGRDLDVFGAHNHVYFGRFEDGPCENEFSGNLVEICPTGVFTDKTLHGRYTRKWDLQTAPSICMLCGAGCNTLPGERYGILRRIRNRYHHHLNGYFLCDRGRFGYQFVNSERRLRQATHRSEKSGPVAAISPTRALEHLGEVLSKPDRLIGIGSPSASLEANYALRALVGAERFSTGLSAEQIELLDSILDILQNGPARSASIRDMEQSDAVLILGEDVTHVMPRAALALRQSVRQEPIRELAQLHIPLWQDAGIREAMQDEKGPLFIATPYATRLDDVATLTYHAAPDDLARLGFAVAHLLDPEAPAVDDLADVQRVLAEAIAGDLDQAERPLVVAGISQGNRALVQAVGNIAWALSTEKSSVRVAFLVPEANTMGLTMMGGGMDLETVRERIADGKADSLIVLERDLYRCMPAEDADTLLNARQVIVLDYLETETTRRADLVLPTTSFAECSGTLINYEGRAQRFFQVFEPVGDILPAHRWLSQARKKAAGDPAGTWESLDAIMKNLAENLEQFAPIPASIPLADFTIQGLKVPRQSPRFSGRTAIHADRNVNVEKPLPDSDAPLVFSMEGFDGPVPGPLIARYWSPGWNSVQALNKFQQETGGPLRGGDPGHRLFETAALPRRGYFQSLPPSFHPQAERWLLVPIYHIFGSEPLSMLSSGVAELAPPPYLALNPADAAELGLAEGQTVLLDGEPARNLPLRLMRSLPHGVAGVAVGPVGSWFSGTYASLRSGQGCESAEEG